MAHDTPVKAGYYTPMLHVADIEASIRFYERLGFTTIDTDRCEPLGWARMHCEGGAVMFLRAEHAVDTSSIPVLFVLYAPDLPRLRDDLLAQGVSVSAIRHPEYMPSGQVNLADPDGYRIEVCHWSQAEHTAWLERIGRG